MRTLGRVDHVILFGSQARGDAAADSDVDLVVVSPGFEGLSFIDRSVRSSEAWTAHTPVDFLCYTPEEFDRLRQEITVVSAAVAEGTEVAAG